MIAEQAIRQLYKDCFKEDITAVEACSAHGSSRQYFRVKSINHFCIATYNDNRKENEAFINYARQLASHNIRVPKIYAEDLDNSIYLQEDLGDVTLYSLLENQTLSRDKQISIYKSVISQLPKIQMVGKDFDYTFAYPRKAFDMQSIEWDLQYFKYYFLKMAHIAFNEEALEKDFKTLANYLLSADSDYFLYRDFQSRNIMFVADEPYFIDFQGGRQGALQYDIASLLYDAKANLSPDIRELLLNYYMEELQKHISIDPTEFRKLFYAFVYVRIMQAMGSYGYRGYFERKNHFLLSIPYAVKNLKWLEENVVLPLDLAELHYVFKQIMASNTLTDIASATGKLTINIKSFSYRKGFPQDVSGNGGGYVFDCRALHNPGRYDHYKLLTGRDKEVIEFLESREDVNQFYSHVIGLINQSCEVYLRRNFTSLSVYFGCTGGQHRSVYMAERLYKELSQRSELHIVLQHVEQSK
ncbi:MAG: phosphotransferase [Bacteroidales bacterium]|jgi:aminoglycoside/choline kinase family phosphotransferase|nr:phosphotransferase [Bacteroidales bacterium]